MYEIVRRFYAYICDKKGLEQATINLVCFQMTNLEQEIMDALAFDGAIIKEGKKQIVMVESILRSPLNFGWMTSLFQLWI